MKYTSILMILAIAAFVPKGNAQNITTIAGNGTGGYNGDNMAATAAEIYFPTQIAADGSGNIFIADHYNNRVRKVDASGVITTIAGNGTADYTGDNGAATAAGLNRPTGVAIDNSGNIYIADNGNSCIRKVDASGVITTIAGNGTANYSGDNGAATAAELNYPSGVTVDGSGNLYIVDVVNQRIRKVDASGIITTFAGNGTGGYNGDNIAATAAEIYEPSAVEADGNGNVYIADFYNQRIRKVNASGIISTFAGSGTSGYSGDNANATAAEISYPSAIKADGNGNVYISDGGNYRIRKINAAGIITTIAGNGTNGYSGDNAPATAAEISNVYGLAIDNSGNLIISDHSNHRIRKMAVPTGINSYNATKTATLTVSPNPATTEVTIKYETSASAPTTIFITNLAGQCVITQNIGKQQKGVIILPVSKLAAGEYTVKLMNGNETLTQKLVKE